MSSFYVQNPWTELVIDIGVNDTHPGPGTPLRANQKASAPGLFQLWQFVTPVDSGGYYAIQNANVEYIKSAKLNAPFVVDIELGDKTKLPSKGARLDAYPNKGEFGGNANQLWSFDKDPETGYYFIFSHMTGLVIDLEEGGLRPGEKPQPGAHLDQWTWKGQSPRNPANVNQLWQFVEPNGALVTPPVTPHGQVG